MPAVAVLAGLLYAASAGAQTAHVDNRCPQLSRATYDELDARVLLLLSGEVRRPLPAVHCSKDTAWVEWEGRRYDLAGKAALADEVVDVVEAQLNAEHGEPDRAVAPEPPAQAATAPPPATPARPGTGRPADRVAQRPSDARGGGISLGIQTELPSGSIATAMGPAFDFAASVGPILLGGREAIRFSVAGRRVSLMDFQASIAYGAPFDPSAHFGVVARFGPEWLVLYPEGNSGQAKVAAVSDVGLRLANSFGMVGLWLGIDAHFRLSPLVLRSRGTLAANDIGGSFTLGVMFVDWSRR